MALEFGIVELAAPGSTGTQNVTISGFGVPDAVIAIRPNTASGTNPAAMLSVGFWDGTNQVGFGSHTANGTAGTWAARGQSTSHILASGFSTSSSSETLVEYGRVTGTVTDGITLTWDFATGALMRYVFIKGVSAATAGAVALTTSSTITDVTVGHEPHVAFFLSVGDQATPDSVTTHNLFSIGVAHYDGTSTSQWMMAYGDQDGISTSAGASIFRNNAVAGQTLWSGETWYATFSRQSSTQFRLTANTASHGDDHVGYLAIALTDPTEFAVGTDTTASSATTKATTGVGFEPNFLGVLASGLSSVNSILTTSHVRAGLGFSDGTTEHAQGIGIADNASTATAYSFETSNLVGLLTGDSASYTHTGTLQSFDSDGFTISYSAANAAKVMGWFAVKAAGGGGVSLIAEDIESSSSVSSPDLGQIHALVSVSVQSTSEVSSPSVGQEHSLLADDVETTSEVSVPSITVGAITLTAEDIESLSEISSPALSQIHSLLSESLESLSEVSSPSIGQIQVLLSIDVESTSEVSSPSIGILIDGDNLFAEDIESATEVSAPTVGQIHVLDAANVESSTEISAPTLIQVHVLLASDVESTSSVTSPSLGSSSTSLTPADIENIKNAFKEALRSILFVDRNS